MAILGWNRASKPDAPLPSSQWSNLSSCSHVAGSMKRQSQQNKLSLLGWQYPVPPRYQIKVWVFYCLTNPPRVCQIYPILFSRKRYCYTLTKTYPASVLLDSMSALSLVVGVLSCPAETALSPFSTSYLRQAGSFSPADCQRHKARSQASPKLEVGP